MNTPTLYTIAGPAGMIETASLLCRLDHSMPKRALLLQHPHPLHGGSMSNKVITTLARAARDGGLPAVAFNYRGVGASEGCWDAGRGELEDAMAVASQMIDQGVQELCLAGFSFGASKSAELIPALRVKYPNLKIMDLVQVAPAVENFPVKEEWVDRLTPWVIFNVDDEVVNPEAMQGYVDRLGVNAVVAAEGGHFFHGQLTRLKEAVTSHWRLEGVI